MPEPEVLALGEQVKELTVLAQSLKTRLDTAPSPITQEALDRVIADAKAAADKADAVEQKFLAEPKRALDPAGEAANARRSELSAIGDYYRLGMVNMPEESRKLLEESRKKLAMATDNSTGSYVVMPPAQATDLLGLLRTFSAMEQVCDVTTIDGVDWEQITVTGAASAARVSERGTRSEGTTPTFGKVAITAHSYYTYLWLTQKQLALTTSLDIAGFVANEGNWAIQALLEDDYLNGTGVGRPFGLLANSTLQTAATHSGSATTIDSFDGVRTMTGAINEVFLPNARFMMKRSTEITLALLKDGLSNYQWQPSVAAGTPNTLFGYPISYNGYLPAVADYATAAYGQVIFGDFKQAYKIIVSRFAFTLRDDITVPGTVKIYKEIAKGGDVMRTEAVNLLEIAA